MSKLKKGTKVKVNGRAEYFHELDPKQEHEINSYIPLLKAYSVKGPSMNGYPTEQIIKENDLTEVKVSAGSEDENFV